MMNKRAFTLVEMLVVMVVTIVMLISVGAICEVGKQGHQKIAYESQLYNDVSYGFKLIQNRVHESRFLDEIVASTPWIGDKLIAGDTAFGVYDLGTSGKEFVYLPDKTDDNNRKTLCKVLATDALTISVDHDAHPANKIVVTLSGTNRGAPFNMSTTVRKRL